MDVDIKKDEEKARVTLRISITPEELEPYLDTAAKELSTERPIKGFRPGKATTEVVMEAHGADTVITHALDKAVPRWFVQAVIEHKIDALGRPASAIEKASVEEGVVFTAEVDVLPEVVLGDAAGITIEKRSVELADDEIDQELAYIAKSRSSYIDVARPAEMGDTVTVDFAVSLEGKVMEGGESKNHPVHLGEGHFVPDFENKMVGILAGDTRDFSITFPDDFANAELRGKEAQATVTAHTVQKRVIPEVNDELAKSLGDFTDVAALRKQLADNVTAEKEQREHERVHGELTDKLAEGATFAALPESLIEREIERRVAELSQMLTWQQKSIEQYLEEKQKTLEQLRDELKEPAVKTVKVSLALRQFAQDQGVQVSDEELDAEVATYMEQQSKSPQAGEIDKDDVRVSAANSLRNQKALAKLEELATISEVAAPVDAKEASA